MVFLPTRANLISKSTDAPVVCLVCGSLNKDALHILFNCEVARHALSSCGVVASDFDVRNWGSSDLVFYFMGSLNQSVQELVVVCLWQIWYNRNCTVFEGVSKDLDFIASVARSFLERFYAANPIALGFQLSLVIGRLRHPVLRCSHV